MSFVDDAFGFVGNIFSGGANFIGDLVGGLFGGDGEQEQAAVPVTPGMEMGQLSAVSEISALGVPSATGGTTFDFSTILSGIETGVGIYGQLAQLEISKGMTEAEKIKAQTALMEAEALRLYAGTPRATPAPVPAPTPIITLTQPAPVPAAAAAAPGMSNIVLYALAIVALLLFRKK